MCWYSALSVKCLHSAYECGCGSAVRTVGERKVVPDDKPLSENTTVTMAGDTNTTEDMFNSLDHDEKLELLYNNSLLEKKNLDILMKNTDQFFLIVIAIIIFFMQCGFAFLEAGSVR